MTDDKTQVPAEEADDFLTSTCELAITTLCMERGGVMHITGERIRKAIETAGRWYPKGMHLHLEHNSDNSLKFETRDASKCTDHDSSEQPADIRVLTPDGGIAAGDELFGPRVGLQGSVSARGRERKVFDRIEDMSPADLLRMNQAQHYLLTVAVARLGGVLEIGKDDYDQATTGIDKFGRGALLVSRDEGRLTAAILSSTDQEGRA